MKIGICTSERDVALLAKKVGFDFIEVNNSAFVMNEERYPDLLCLSRELSGFMYSCNGLVPASIRLTGPDFDAGRIREYAAKCTERLDLLGVKMLVFGSSAAKNVPDGFSFERAMDQLVEALRIFSDEAANYGQRICIEPLRFAECNIINTLEDSLGLADLVGCENLGSHVDYFHLMQNGESLESLRCAANRILHAHIASPIKRRAPQCGDGADYRAFFANLHAGGYDATVSIEGGFERTESELDTICRHLRECVTTS